MKIIKLLVIGISIFYFDNIYAQHSNELYKKYASNIKSFPLDNLTINKNNFQDGTTEIIIKNRSNNILRFKVDKKNTLLGYHAGVVFQLFEYKDGYLHRETTYDKNGHMHGEESACVEYIIEKPEVLMNHFKIIDQADGNAQPDSENDKIILARVFNDKGELISTSYVSSHYYWGANNMSYRP